MVHQPFATSHATAVNSRYTFDVVVVEELVSVEVEVDELVLVLVELLVVPVLKVHLEQNTERSPVCITDERSLLKRRTSVVVAKQPGGRSGLFNSTPVVMSVNSSAAAAS